MRILYSDNGTITDYSVNLSRYKTGSHSATINHTQDALYFGSTQPFNHFYLKLGNKVNSNAASFTLQYWEGDEWKNAIDVIDETSLSGKTFAQSGFITFSTNTRDGWYRESTNDQGDTVDGLTSVNILNQYWLKMTFSASLTECDFLWCGQIFCNDDDLYSEYPIFNRANIKSSFEAGKTDWEEQCIAASEILINDLMAKNIIKHNGQVIVRENLRRACVCKAAEIIFNAFGDNYIDDKIAARNEYQARLKNPIYQVDLNENARLDVYEEKKTVGWLSR